MSDSCVYISDKKFGWLPANVLSQDDKGASVRVFDVDGNNVLEEERKVKLKDYPNEQLPLQNIDAGGNLMQMPNMVDLPSLHEAAILYNLRARHMGGNPYTRVGDLIIAVNPFQWMKHLYSEQNRTKYVHQLIYNANASSGADIREGLDPHVYETSCMAYRGLAVDGKHQSILVSGESGAGKTETVKIVMRHLSSITEGAAASGVVQRVLDGQPLLEAFGNAKTVRNDNSSRFGKFIQMQFDVEDATQAAFSGRAVPNCVLAGSNTETYLLEKSRVVSHEDTERTYHIFYQLLAASAEYQTKYMPHLKGKFAKDFIYVGEANSNIRIEGKTDDLQFERTLGALTTLGLNEHELKTLFGAVICCMQLGNIAFDQDPDDDEKSVITSRDELTTLSQWLEVEEAVVEKTLTYRTIVAGKESYSVPLKLGDARDGCDAFAKEIYQQIFDWLVGEINRRTCAEENYDDAQDVEEYGLIGLLDIFGFESFKVNRFEQLCINYTNEKLQQKYTLDIFRSVQDEYSHEGIELGEIPFEDNDEVLRLIEGKIGIISVLNEECVRPKGNDTAFVSKIKTVNKEVTCLINDRLHKPTEFAITHYAGPVKYDATNFVQKNTDALPNDFIECACQSSNDIIKLELKAAADAKLAAASSGGRVGKRGAGKLTVATKFKSQLSRLMVDITQTKTRYIRCIKPNPEKEPLKMNMFSSAEQLRCAGVVAAVTISRVAFPNRLMHETAIERFTCLSDMNLDDIAEGKKDASENDETGFRDAVTTLLDGLLENLQKKNDEGNLVKAYECGKSRVYFRLGALEFLEAERLVALGVLATAIERIVRGFTARSKFWKLRDATIDSQANVRRTNARRRFLKAKTAGIVIECWIRCVYAKRELGRLQRDKAAIHIQSKWRSVLAMAVLQKSRSATILIQKIVRGALQRPKYRQAVKEAEEEARVNSKLAALQKRLKDAEMKFFQADKKRIEAEKKAEALGQHSVGSGLTVEIEEKKIDAPGSAQQQALIDESNEMLDYFRKEVFKHKSANYLLRTDYSALQEDHRQLQSHSQSLEASYTAMKQNVSKVSQNNMKLGLQLADQKDYIAKLRQDLKMERIRNAAELNRRSEELLGQKKLYEAELNRFMREIERLRSLVAQGEGPEAEEAARPDPKFERASFHRDEEEVTMSILRMRAAAGPKSMAPSLNSLTAGYDGGDAQVAGEHQGRRPYYLRRKFRPFRSYYSGGGGRYNPGGRFHHHHPSGRFNPGRFSSPSGRFNVGGRFGSGRFIPGGRFGSPQPGRYPYSGSSGFNPYRAPRGGGLLPGRSFYREVPANVSPNTNTSLGAAAMKSAPVPPLTTSMTSSLTSNSSLAQAIKTPSVMAPTGSLQSASSSSYSSSLGSAAGGWGSRLQTASGGGSLQAAAGFGGSLQAAAQSSFGGASLQAAAQSSLGGASLQAVAQSSLGGRSLQAAAARPRPPPEAASGSLQAAASSSAKGGGSSLANAAKRQS